MKKLLIPFLLLSFTLVGCGSSSIVNIDGPEECSTQARTFVDNYKYGVPDFTYQYKNHYNKKDNKCYVLMWANESNGGDNILWDIYENKSIAQCEWYSADTNMNFCGYPGSSEKYDINKFNNFVKKYMEG